MKNFPDDMHISTKTKEKIKDINAITFYMFKITFDQVIGFFIGMDVNQTHLNNCNITGWYSYK